MGNPEDYEDEQDITRYYKFCPNCDAIAERDAQGCIECGHEFEAIDDVGHLSQANASDTLTRWTRSKGRATMETLFWLDIIAAVVFFCREDWRLCTVTAATAVAWHLLKNER